MMYTECCQVEIDETDINTCPACLEHCSFIEIDEDEQKEPPMCYMCSGTGEGMWDGSYCSTCNGSGVIIEKN